MRSLPTIGAGLALLLSSGVAYAGGFGLLGAGGLHEGRAYYYRDDGEQGVDVQHRPNFSLGGEVLLGDREDRVNGMARIYFLGDMPLNTPDLSQEDKSHEYTFPPDAEQPIRKVGVMTIGAQWGLYGDPTDTQLILTTMVGSGFATLDKSEFLVFEPAVGVSKMLGDNFQLAANLAFTGRYRKRFYVGENVYVGLRYMFD
jgi:hypothetical protein